jgi:hypothetical protein
MRQGYFDQLEESSGEPFRSPRQAPLPRKHAGGSGCRDPERWSLESVWRLARWLQSWR